MKFVKGDELHEKAILLKSMGRALEKLPNSIVTQCLLYTPVVKKRSYCFSLSLPLSSTLSFPSLPSTFNSTQPLSDPFRVVSD